MVVDSKRHNKNRQLATEMRKGRKVDMRYYGVTVNDDYIKMFVVLNGAIDPTMFVESEVADGTNHRWQRIEEDGRSVFLAPASYIGGPIAWVHDKQFLSEGMIYEQTKVYSGGIYEGTPGDLQAAQG